MIIILITVIIIILLLNGKLFFTSSDPTQQFLSDTLNDRTIISNILSDSEFMLLVNNVPGQTVFNISGDPPVLSKTISEGNVTKLNSSKLNFSKLSSKCDEIILAINNYISKAQNSTIYTPERLKAFELYYENMVNNISIIRNYILSLI
jgi:hypothetical protein